MAVDKLVHTDVLIIGGGLAGLFAAISAREHSANVTIVEKAYSGKSGGAATGAGLFAVFNPDLGHDLKTWTDFIVGIGEYLNNRDWVEVILKESSERYQDLLKWGIPFSSTKGRSWTPNSYAMPLVKRVFMPMLRDRAIEAGTEIIDRVMITDLVSVDGCVVGAVGFDDREGDFYQFRSHATIVATGSGTFKLPGWNDSYWTADGDAMNYRAGAEIVSKEFGGKDAGTLKDYSFARVGVLGGYDHWVNAAGDPFYEKYAPRYHTEQRRMIYSVFEVHDGRGPIYIDFDKATAEELKKISDTTKISGLNWLSDRVGLDPAKKGKTEITFGSWVGYQPSLGGAVINTDCETSLSGLYAAGDCAGTRMCGSCYAPWGYGLAGASVTGYRAGKNAAEFALNNSTADPPDNEIKHLKEILYAPLLRTGGFSHTFITQVLRNTMMPYYIMQIKSEDRMQAALTMVEFFKSHLIPRMRAVDPHELRMAHEVRNMTLNAEMILRSSLYRKESRGTHYREDFPAREDPKWLAWIILKNQTGSMKLSRRVLPKKWWPDLSRPYRDRYELRFPGENR